MDILNIGKALVRRHTDGKYLILSGSVWPERPDRSQKPDLPGGRIETGETIQQGCCREILEEIGITVQSDELHLVHSASFIDKREAVPVNRLLFLIELQDDPQITLSWEHESYSWYGAKELLTLEMRQPYPEIFKYLYSANLLI